MKLSLVLLVLSLSVSATNYGQYTINLNEQNISLTDVFRKIEKKSAFRFYFSNDVLPAKYFTSIYAENASLDEVMGKILVGANLSWKQLPGNKVVVATNVAASKADPKRTITGIVKDSKGAPLENISVVIKGTGTGVTTSETGRFSINANNGDVLVFSAVGYQTKEVTISGQETLDVTLLAVDNSLNEVIVVAYGTQKKENLTNSVATISGKVLENRPLTRLSQGLQGMVAGLNITTGTGGGNPNATQSINIRGYTGIGSVQAGGPLIVIDGVQGGDINNINPDDVESISVLKDVAATAIYGSSAPYGAILITTKKGKKNQKATISYNNSFNWAQTINLPTMLNSLTFANLYNEAFRNAGGSDFFSAETIDRIKAYQAGTFKDQTIKNPAAGANGWQNWNTGNANNDWFKIYFKDFSFSQQHNVAVSGGSDKTSYYVGMGYNDRNGMFNYGKDDFKRYNVRANLTTNITSWLTFNFRSSFSRSLFNTPNTYSGQTGGNYMHQFARKFPTVSLINPDGHYSDESNVPLHLEGGRDRRLQDQPMLTGELVFTPLKGWNITANYTFDGSVFDQQNHLKTVYVYRPDGTTYASGGTSPNRFDRYNERNEHQITNIFSSYEKTISKHYFKALGGFTSELTSFTSYSAGNSNLYSNDIPSLNLTYGTAPSIGDQIRKLAVAGYFGRLNYIFDNKYMVEFNGRYDATSRFLADRRWKFSPGISAGWNVDKENFWVDIKPTINAFKLRGSYGSSPDQLFLGDPSMTSWYPFYPSLGTTRPTNTSWLFNGAQEAAVSQPPLVNDGLTWVTQTSYGIGTDMALLRSRLNISFDWFIRKANNFAFPPASTSLPALLGIGIPAVNSAGMRNKGYDLTIQWQDHIGTDFGYSLRGVLSDYKGQVVKFNNPGKSFSNSYYVSQTLGEIWGYTTDGFYTTATAGTGLPASFWTGAWTAGDIKYKDLDGSGRIDGGKGTADSSGDRRVIGNNTPRYQYSFTASADYKGFDLMIYLQGIGKRDAWIGSNYFWGIVGDEWQSSPFTAHLDRWTPETPNGYFPKYYMSSQNNKNTQVQTKYLQNAAYMRIKTVQLGYTLPQQILAKVRAQRIRLFANVENLATFTKLIKTMDPELSISDAKIYPLQRTYSFGLNVTF